MRRRTLTEPVSLRGRDIFGRPSTLTFEPVREQGLFWKQEGGTMIAISDARLTAHPLFHYLTLWNEDGILKIPEHLLGALFILGVDSVCFSSDGKHLPYDGCARSFGEILAPALVEEGDLVPYTLNDSVHIERGERRFVTFRSREESLRYRVEVDYPNIGNAVVRNDLESVDALTILSARPQGRNYLHWAASRLTGQTESCVWLKKEDADEIRKEKLEEIARQRLLDFFGALASVCPPGGTLRGYVHTRLVGHAADLKLIEEIRKLGFKRLQ